jgi:hypothetical protein
MTEGDESVVEHSGLFDRDWYLARYPEAGNVADVLAHFCREGWRHGFQPNPYFHPTWYTRTYGAELVPGENPLLHYIRRGERENAWPSADFDPEWYRDEYALDGSESPLRDYLHHRVGGTRSPLPVFDVADYTANHPEYLASGLDPYLHWLQRAKEAVERPPPSASPFGRVVDLLGGSLESGNIPDMASWDAVKDVLRVFIPLIPFDEDWYCKCYPDVAAAVKCRLITSAHQHFIDYGFFEGRSPAAAAVAPST